MAGRLDAGDHGGVAALRDARADRWRSAVSAARRGARQDPVLALARVAGVDVRRHDGDQFLGAAVPAAHDNLFHLLHRTDSDRAHQYAPARRTPRWGAL